ncbi:hypothetical protein FRB94_010034 [Tulasnella sp. JGI-2019a]|nr:hypothetical protein FRB94_010034 [Tulasnella sp. JGI-2019a]
MEITTNKIPYWDCPPVYSAIMARILLGALPMSLDNVHSNHTKHLFTTCWNQAELKRPNRLFALAKYLTSKLFQHSPPLPNPATDRIESQLDKITRCAIFNPDSMREVSNGLQELENLLQERQMEQEAHAVGGYIEDISYFLVHISGKTKSHIIDEKVARKSAENVYNTIQTFRQGENRRLSNATTQPPSGGTPHLDGSNGHKKSSRAVLIRGVPSQVIVEKQRSMQLDTSFDMRSYKKL